MIVIYMDGHSLTVTGHAGYTKSGNDIICAAVSALTQGLIHSLMELTKDEISFQMRDGYIRLEHGNLSEQGRLLMDSFFIAISDIQETYGDQYVLIGDPKGPEDAECPKTLHEICRRTLSGR